MSKGNYIISKDEKTMRIGRPFLLFPNAPQRPEVKPGGSRVLPGAGRSAGRGNKSRSA